MRKEKQIEYLDQDFLGNKINIGDEVIFEAPQYRNFVIGKVVTKAKKTCQIEYVNNWNYSNGITQIIRQAYDQIIKHNEGYRKQSEGEWVGIEYDGYADGYPVYDVFECSVCGNEWRGDTPPCFCPDCGSKMKGRE